jgi:hypothetical protein
VNSCRIFEVHVAKLSVLPVGATNEDFYYPPQNLPQRRKDMFCKGRKWLVVVALFTIATMAGIPASAQQKPNILFIMGGDIGWMQPSIYHRGLALGETPNIDRIGREGAIFMTYYAE